MGQKKNVSQRFKQKRITHYYDYRWRAVVKQIMFAGTSYTEIFATFESPEQRRYREKIQQKSIVFFFEYVTNK